MEQTEQKVSLDRGIILRKQEEYEVYMCDGEGQDQQITTRRSVILSCCEKVITEASKWDADLL